MHIADLHSLNIFAYDVFSILCTLCMYSMYSMYAMHSLLHVYGCRYIVMTSCARGRFRALLTTIYTRDAYRRNCVFSTEIIKTSQSMRYLCECKTDRVAETLHLHCIRRDAVMLTCRYFNKKRIEYSDRSFSQGVVESLKILSCLLLSSTD